jgi:hypothetical protein
MTRSANLDLARSIDTRHWQSDGGIERKLGRSTAPAGLGHSRSHSKSVTE